MNESSGSGLSAATNSITFISYTTNAAVQWRDPAGMARATNWFLITEPGP